MATSAHESNVMAPNFPEGDDSSLEGTTQSAASTPISPPSGNKTASEPFGVCLAQVLEVIPDVSHEHVHKLWTQQTADAINRGIRVVISHQLVDALLEATSYPKERDRQRELKRKRDEAEDPEQAVTRWKARASPFEYNGVA